MNKIFRLPLGILLIALIIFFCAGCPSGKTAPNFLKIVNQEDTLLNSDETEEPFKLSSVEGGTAAGLVTFKNSSEKEPMMLISVKPVSDLFVIKRTGDRELELPYTLAAGTSVVLEIHYKPEIDEYYETEVIVKYYMDKAVDNIGEVKFLMGAEVGDIHAGVNNTGIVVHGENILKYDFGETLLGEEKTYPLVLRNADTTGGSVSIYDVVCSNESFFVSGFEKYSTISTDGELSFFVNFTPQSDTFLDEYLVVYSSNGMFSFILRGKGVLNPLPIFTLKKGDKKVENNSLLFIEESVVATPGDEVELVITNMGVGTLTINDVFSTIPGQLAITAVDLPIDISYQNKYYLSVKLTPAAAEAITGTLIIKHNQSDFFNLSIKSGGILPGSPEIQLYTDKGDPIASDDTVDLDATVSGYITYKEFKIKNLGDSPLSLESIQLLVKGVNVVSVDSYPVNIAPGMIYPVTMSFAPDNEGVYSGQMLVISNDLDESNAIFNLKGNCIEALPLLAPVVTGPAYSIENRQPQWEFKTTQGSSGISLFRYKFNQDNLESGAVETDVEVFTPEAALDSGFYTLYVQEKNLFGQWSPIASHTIEVNLERPSAPSLTVDDLIVLDGKDFLNKQSASMTWVPVAIGDIEKSRYSFNGGKTWSETQLYQASTTEDLVDGETGMMVLLQDRFGRWSPITSTSVVIDTTGPEIIPIDIVAGNKTMLLPVGEAASAYDRGVTALDVHLGDCQSTLETLYTGIDNGQVGLYQITYKAKDRLENSSEVTRDLYVVNLETIQFEWSLNLTLWEDKTAAPELRQVKIHGGTPFTLRFKLGTIHSSVSDQVSLKWNIGEAGDLSGNITDFIGTDLSQVFTIAYENPTPTAVDVKRVVVEVSVKDKLDVDHLFSTDGGVILPIYPQ